jgi:hypothetical protein
MPPVRTSLVPFFALFVLLPALASAQTPAPPAEEPTLESAIEMRNNREVRNALPEPQITREVNNGADFERALGEE